jgi:hypothetical protein
MVAPMKYPEDCGNIGAAGRLEITAMEVGIIWRISPVALQIDYINGAGRDSQDDVQHLKDLSSFFLL